MYDRLEDLLVKSEYGQVEVTTRVFYMLMRILGTDPSSEVNFLVFILSFNLQRLFDFVYFRAFETVPYLLKV